jgi:acetyl-CoA C-acetyltransferase
MSRVGIIGIGHTVFGRRSDATVQELAFEAYRAALQDGQVEPEIIEATVIGSM